MVNRSSMNTSEKLAIYTFILSNLSKTFFCNVKVTSKVSDKSSAGMAIFIKAEMDDLWATGNGKHLAFKYRIFVLFCSINLQSIFH